MDNKVICFFNSAKSWGGGEKWHFDIATRLHNKGYKIIVITNKQSELFKRLLNTGIKTFPIKISNYSFLNPIKKRQVLNILRQEKVSTIIINLPSDLKVAARAAKVAGVKKTIYRRGSAIPIKNKLLNRIIFKKYIDEIIANSEATKRTILSNNPNLFNIDKIRVIYNGIILDDIENNHCTNIYQKKDNEIIIGNAGRFVKQKNHKCLINLAVELKKRDINFKMLLAGTGKLKADIMGLAIKMQVDDKIIFPGFIEDIGSFMKCIDIYILPSLWEGFGYIIVEAMINEIPVIAFDLSSNPEIIDNNKTGFLVEEDNLEEMIQKINLFIQNPNLLKEMGKEGKKRVHNLFTIDRTVEEVEKIIA